MEKAHDTFRGLGAGTPVWFTLSARALPLGLLGQFLLAGLGLFTSPGLLDLHGSVGGLLGLPVATLVGGSLLLPRLRGFRWWTGLIGLLYLVQVALGATGAPLPLSFHPLNAGLLLTASLVLLTKVERRLGDSHRVPETIQ